jgi:selenide,water dikinase
MQQRVAIAQDLVLVVGGHAHVRVLRGFGMRLMPGACVTLISRDVETPYSGMLPGYVAGHYSFEECHIDLGRLARFAAARLIRDEAIGLDRAGRFVLCRGHRRSAGTCCRSTSARRRGKLDWAGSLRRACNGQ